jgi:hypothetical protein
MIMTVEGMRNSSDVLRNAYRATFQEYANKLDSLQRLMSASSIDASQMETTMLEVEKARVAHNSARDRLASELMNQSVPRDAGTDEQHVRKTARLLWELAGCPEGTAERDWRQAERLVRTAASCAG